MRHGCSLLEQLQQRPVSESRSHKIGSGQKLSSPAGPEVSPDFIRPQNFLSWPVLPEASEKFLCVALSVTTTTNAAPNTAATNAGATAPPRTAATVPPRRCHHHRLHRDKHGHHRRRHWETTDATNIHAFGIGRSSVGARSTRMDHG
jgi:hypothetical protein